MHKCAPANTPLSASVKLFKADSSPLDDDDASRYRSLVGGLQYLSLTRLLFISISRKT
jgi:hypothetical protein